MQKTKIALFPLQVMLIPGERSRLHIFEERYRQLIEDCGQPGTRFGIPYAVNGLLSGIGCLVEVTDVIQQYKNGSADIEILCSDLFRIEQFYLRMGSKLYPGGEVSMIGQGGLCAVGQHLLEKLDLYFRHAEPDKFGEILDPNLNIFKVALLLRMDEDQKIKLAKAKTHEERERVLLNQLLLLEALQAQKNSIKGSVFLN